MFDIRVAYTYTDIFCVGVKIWRADHIWKDKIGYRKFIISKSLMTKFKNVVTVEKIRFAKGI